MYCVGGPNVHRAEDVLLQSSVISSHTSDSIESDVRL